MQSDRRDAEPKPEKATELVDPVGEFHFRNGFVNNNEFASNSWFHTDIIINIIIIIIMIPKMDFFWNWLDDVNSWIRVQNSRAKLRQISAVVFFAMTKACLNKIIVLHC